jgi:CubicO group peptidase (beta-lactamase class C family)
MKTCIAIIFLLLAGAAQADGLDEAIRAEMAREQVPGLTLAVVRHGEIVREGAYGYADLEWNAKTTLDTRFEVASVSKMIAGAAARILIEEGKLSPEDPVGKFFGDLPPAWAA